jgi:hypothetical protein
MNAKDVRRVLGKVCDLSKVDLARSAFVSDEFAQRYMDRLATRIAEELAAERPIELPFCSSCGTPDADGYCDACESAYQTGLKKAKDRDASNRKAEALKYFSSLPPVDGTVFATKEPTPSLDERMTDIEKKLKRLEIELERRTGACR